MRPHSDTMRKNRALSSAVSWNDFVSTSGAGLASAGLAGQRVAGMG
jgi:hypothetical protein